MKPKRLTEIQLNTMVADWNKSFPIGTHVSVLLDNGTVEETLTNSPAWVIGGHSALVGLIGHSGGYNLLRVTPTDPSNPSNPSELREAA